MTIISELGTLILKLRAQLLASPWHHDPSTGHVTHPAHDIMPNTHNVFKEYSTFLFTGEMFRETTFFLRNSSFTVLGTGECVRCNRGLLNIVSCRAKNWFFFFVFLFCFVLFYCAQCLHVFPRFRQFPCFLSEFSLAPCDSFLVSDLTWWCFLWWFHNTLEKSTLMEFFLSFGHLRVSDGFVMLHKKGASGVLYSLNKGVLLILSRRGKINCQTDRAICSIFKDFKRF